MGVSNVTSCVSSPDGFCIDKYYVPSTLLSAGDTVGTMPASSVTEKTTAQEVIRDVTSVTCLQDRCQEGHHREGQPHVCGEVGLPQNVAHGQRPKGQAGMTIAGGACVRA